VKKLDCVRRLVESDWRRYEVVPEKDGPELTLDPPITPMAELDAMQGPTGIS